MISDGMAGVLRSLYAFGDADPASAFAEVLGVDDVTVSVVLDAGHTEPLWSSGRGPDLAELQRTFGEGPEPDATRSGDVVLVPDLGAVPADRWPLLLPAVAELPAKAVFCFPLGIGAIRVGVLTAARARPGPLSGTEVTDALALASALTTLFLDGSGRGDGGLRVAHLPHGWQQAVVHQATGMVSVQLSISLAAALLRLRATAYSRDQSIVELSQEVVSRRLRFNDSTSGLSRPGESRG
ncbi:ANTAR domain-containing protein [Streptomyces sp. NPDC002537]